MDKSNSAWRFKGAPLPTKPSAASNQETPESGKAEAFYRFRAFHRIDSSSFELFPLVGWNFALLLHFDADREELVYQEVCALVIALSVYLAN